MIEDIVFGLFRFIGFIFYHFFIEIICFYTGEIVLWIFSIGKRKPRWDYYQNETLSKTILFSEITTWIGISFWVALFVLIIKVIGN